MVKHIILIKLKDFNDAEKTKEVLLSMRGNVPQALSVDVNIDMLRSDRSYDVMLEVLVENFDKLEEYQNDPYHCGVVKKFIHAVRTASVSIDFEIG